MDKCLCSICSGETKIKKIDIDQAHAFLRPIQEQYEAELTALKTQLAEKDERLAEAEGLLRKWLNEAECLEAWRFEMQEGCFCINCENYRETAFFLTPTNPADDPSNCLAGMGVPTVHICPTTITNTPDSYSPGIILKGDVSVTSNAKSNFEARSYLDKPYHRCFVPDPSGGYTGYIREFPGCVTEGMTLEETYSRLEAAAGGWIGAALKLDQGIPEPLERPWPTDPDMVLVRREDLALELLIDNPVQITHDDNLHWEGSILFVQVKEARNRLKAAREEKP